MHSNPLKQFLLAPPSLTSYVSFIPNYSTGTLRMGGMVKEFKALESSNLRPIQFIDRVPFWISYYSNVRLISKIYLE